MPTAKNKARLKTLYAKLGSLRATAASSDPGRAAVMKKEAKMVAAEIKKIKDSYKEPMGTGDPYYR